MRKRLAHEVSQAEASRLKQDLEKKQAWLRQQKDLSKKFQDQLVQMMEGRLAEAPAQIANRLKASDGKQEELTNRRKTKSASMANKQLAGFAQGKAFANADSDQEAHSGSYDKYAAESPANSASRVTNDQ